jgi:formylglycine-generating enzyme required for sulfatase activity
MSLSSDLVAKLVDAVFKGTVRSLSRRLRTALDSPEREAAFRRVLGSGLLAFVARAPASAVDGEGAPGVIQRFFSDDDVAAELAALVSGRGLNTAELTYLFGEAAAAQPAGTAIVADEAGLGPALTALEEAVAARLVGEPSLQHLVESGGFGRGDGATVRNPELVDFLAAIEPSTATIHAGRISARNVVSGVQVIYATSPRDGVDEEVKSLRQAYLSRLFGGIRNLSLAGMGPKAVGDIEEFLDLNAVYTDLDVLAPDVEAHLRWRTDGRAPAVWQLGRKPKLVLLGEPGSGKSTFVTFIMLCMAGEGLGDPDVNLQRIRKQVEQFEESVAPAAQARPGWPLPVVPVRVILREFAARGLPSAGEPGRARHVWAFLEEELDRSALREYAPHLRRELMDSGGLVCFDGLDEVPEADRQREQIREAILDFAATFDRCRFLVTSRTYAYRDQGWRLPEFGEAVIADFDDDQIGTFISRWYAHIGQLRALDAEAVRNRAELLRKAILTNDRILELARRPLLLTLMASLHAGRGGSLPERREELYADSVDLLLDYWESQRLERQPDGTITRAAPSLVEWLRSDRQQIRSFLNRLAYRAHAAQHELTGTADIAEGDLVSGLTDLSRNPDVRPKRLVQYLSQRAGILVQRAPGIYAFPHRTFQEYLAACHLTDCDDFPDNLARLVAEDPLRWREVSPLAAAKAGRGASAMLWQVIRALCPLEPTPETVDHPPVAWSSLHAAEALVDSDILKRIATYNQDVIDRVRRWQVRLTRSRLPAGERIHAGTMLARLGDPRVEVVTADHTEFCHVPAGPFVFGREPSSGRDHSEGMAGFERFQYAPHVCDLDYPYWISRFPVTMAQFQEFVDDGGYRDARYWSEAVAAGIWRAGKLRRHSAEYKWDGTRFVDGTREANQPIMQVIMYEAVAYCRWLGDRLCAGVPLAACLPSEAEWEKAARGGLQIPEVTTVARRGSLREPHRVRLVDNPMPARRYPWGDDEDLDRKNGGQRPGTPGCFPLGVSPYGVEDLLNPWQWTRSLWNTSASEQTTQPDNRVPYDPFDGRERLDAPRDRKRAIRGTGPSTSPQAVSCAYRLSSEANSTAADLGFRVALIPTEVAQRLASS